jgi:hypothetical protein
VIRSATSASNSNSTRTVTVSCNAGEKVLGGGAYVTNPQNAVALTASYPASATSWTAEAVETDSAGGNWSITAYAICG